MALLQEEASDAVAMGIVVEKQMFPLLVLTAMEWEVKGLTK